MELAKSGNFAYIDYKKTSTNTYQATNRLGVTVSSVVDDGNTETQNMGVAIGGTSASGDSMNPYILVNYEVIAG